MSSQSWPIPILLYHVGKHSQAEDANPGHGHDTVEGLPGEHTQTLRQDWRDSHQAGIPLNTTLEEKVSSAAKIILHASYFCLAFIFTCCVFGRLCVGYVLLHVHS